MTPGWTRYLYRLIAREISTLSRYCDEMIQWCPLAHDDGYLFEQIHCPKKHQEARSGFAKADTGMRRIVLLNGNLNYSFQIQELLGEVKSLLNRHSRVVAVVYNPYLAWLYRLASSLRLRTAPVPPTFLTHNDLRNICRLSGYELVRSRPAAYVPTRLLGLGSFLNKLLPALPIARWLGFVSVVTLRPILTEGPSKPSLSIVIPARNEKGNIENALKRMPDLGTEIEILFVEGHSKDDTWGEIQRVAREYGTRFKIQTFQQTGKGKNDAVRLGFAHAKGELLTILDADLTMPPELLGEFFGAYCSGLADFVNGTRLVYPMEGDAMRFLNRLGNIFFAKALSFVLDVPLGDSLCGTKLLSRRDYERVVAWREDFGEFDPFGDFELLFPAAILGLGIVDIPIRYRARSYGTTNISRFAHGWMLLQMTLTGFFRIKTGPRKPRRRKAQA